MHRSYIAIAMCAGRAMCSLFFFFFFKNITFLWLHKSIRSGQRSLALSPSEQPTHSWQPLPLSTVTHVSCYTHTHTCSHASPEMGVIIRSMEIFWILKRWSRPKECLCRQCLAVVATTRGNTTTLFDPSHRHRAIWWVLSKNSNKCFGTKYCKWISVRASALSPFINEQVFVSRQRSRIDSIRLLDKWLLHLLQRVRRKHRRSGEHTSKWNERSLCCSSTAATVFTSHVLQCEHDGNNHTEAVIKFSCSSTTHSPVRATRGGD